MDLHRMRTSTSTRRTKFSISMQFRKNYFILALIGVVSTHGSGAAVDPPAVTSPPLLALIAPVAELQYLNYEDAVRIALNDNVDLLALRNQEESLKFQSKQALSPNEPTVSLQRVDIPGLSLTQRPAVTIYQLNWTLGFPGKALSNSASIRNLAVSTSEQARAQEITIMTSLSNSYVTFATNQSFYRFLLEEQQKDKDLERLIEKKFAASQASKVDLLNASVATQQIAQALVQNRNDYAVQLTQFRQIIRRPMDKTLLPRIPDNFVIPDIKRPFEELIPVMLKNNHAVAAAQSTLASQSALHTNAMLQALPDLQFTAGINQWLPGPAPNPTTPRDYTLGLAIVVPIFYPFNELQGVHAAGKNLAAAENQLTSQQLQAISGLQTAYTSLKATLKDLEMSEKLVVPAAKASYDLTLLTYGLGKADYFMLNQSRRSWHDSLRDVFTKRQSAAQFYNQLIAQMGCDIARTEGPNVCK